MRNIYYLVFCIITFGLVSCGCPKSEVLATYALSEHSLDQRLYLNTDTAVFVNSEMKERILTNNEYSTSDELHTYNPMCTSSFITTGNQYEYIKHSLVLMDDSVVFEISSIIDWVMVNGDGLRILSEDDEIPIDSISVFDALSVRIKFINEWLTWSTPTDFKDADPVKVTQYYQKFSDSIIEDTLILNREMENVYKVEDVHENSFYFSKENGVEAFYMNEEMWVLDRMY